MSYVYASERRTGRTPQAPTRQMGAWKLAYADFLTALCAFFLVMWIVHGISADKRSEIAQQFASPATKNHTDLISGGAIERQAMNVLAQSELGATSSANIKWNSDGTVLRIELIDLDNRPLFEKGSSDLNARGTALTAKAAKAIKVIGKPVSIEGHTDSDPVLRTGYSNWELSAERANSARRALIEAGLPGHLIVSVAGLADTQPLNSDAPDLPQNRRLSIVIHLD